MESDTAKAIRQLRRLVEDLMTRVEILESNQNSTQDSDLWSRNSR